MCDGGFSVVSSVVNARPARIGPTVCDDDGPIPMRNMSKTDSGCGASCAATSPETIAAGVGRDGSYVVTDVPRATGRRSMGTIVQQPPWGLPVVGGARQIPGRWPARSPAAARPARPRAVRAASFARSGRSRGPPWPCRRPRAPQPHRRPCGGLRACLSFACCRPGSAAHARSSFARNSREDVSGFEIGSLIFCGFRAVDERGPGGITCDFDKGTAGCGRLGPADHARSSFACNSPENVSSFEVGSLIFRGF